MIVVSDTSPILNLHLVGQLELLQKLYDKVIIAEPVWNELTAIGLEEIKVIIGKQGSWLERRSASNRQLVNSLLLELDAGEAESIALAIEAGANLLLIDERLGRKVASRLGVKFIELAGVLIQAKRNGLITAVKPILDMLIAKAGFWISGQLYNRILDEVNEQK